MLKPRPKITTILAGKDQRHILKPEFSLRYKPGLWMGIFFLLCNFSLFGNPTEPMMPPCTGPTITLQPRDSTTIVGSGADFFVRASGVGTLTYQWQLKTPPDAGFFNIAVTTRSLVINNAELSANGNQYRVIVSDDNGTPNYTNDDCQVTSNAATLGVTGGVTPCTGPTITLQPRDSTTIVGSGADFFIRASGVGTLTYQWQLKTPQDAEFSNIAVTTRSLVINNVELSANGNQYRVIVSDDNGTPNDTNDDCQVTSNVATLGITGISCTGPTITLQPQDSITRQGGGAGFFVNASGVGSLTYQWQLKTPQASTFSDIPAATFASLQVNPTANDNGNEYRVIITDDNNTPSDMLDDCQVTSNLAILWVSCSGATITRQPQDATIIAGESVTFSVEASGVGNLGYLWQWKSPTEAEFPLTSFVAPATITLLPPDSLNGFQYRAIVTDDNNTPNEFSDDCLVFSDAATLTINEDLPELFWNNALIDENGFLIRNLIRGAKLDGSGIDSLTTSFSPFDIKVDTAGGKMYWVNTNVPDGVFSANLDGSNTVNLIQGNSDLTSPFSLELDLLNGKIYVYAFFYQQEFSSLISMNLDGSNIQLVRRGLPFLPFRSGFKLDLLANKLYAPGSGAFYDSYDWDPQTDTITNPVPIPISLPNDISQGGPFDIDLENCQIYFAATNRVNGTGNAFIQIYRANLDGSGVPELLHSLTPTDNIIQDLSLDLTNQHLYFSLGYNNLNIGGTNLIGQGIDRIDLDGSNRTEIISLPDQLTLFEGYFTQINAPVANTDKITRIKVAKLTSEEGNPSYGFTGANGLGAFTVEGNSYKAFPNLAPGTYTIMEDALAAGIILEGITIEGDLDDGSVIDLANRTITVDLDQDEDITVTFNNVEQPLFLNLTSFTLVDAETNTEIREIKDGDKLLLENVPSSFTIIAKVEGTRTTDRVFIDLNGPVNNERTERRAPYAVFGDSRGNYSGRPPVAGIYGITATPFYDEGGLQAGTSLTINFEIIDCASGGPSVSAGPANRLDCSSGEAILMGRVTGGTGMTTTSWSGPNGYSSSDLMPTVNLAGTYTLTVTDSLGCTDSGEVLIAPCLASCDPQVVRFTLVDAKSDTEIRELVDNAVIDLGQDGRDLGIIAEVSCESEVRSVKLELLGTQVRTRTENKAPFSLTGDINGDYRDQEFIPGTYTLKATPFTERNAQGSAGIELMINFTVINGTPAQQTQFGDPSLNPGYELSVYPVPTDQELIIDMKFFEQGVYEAELFDVAGRTILSQTLIYEEGIGKRFSLDTQSLVVGVYMLRIAGQRYQEWKKVSIRR